MYYHNLIFRLSRPQKKIVLNGTNKIKELTEEIFLAFVNI